MTNPLNYETYYSEQMNFIHRYLTHTSTKNDAIRLERINDLQSKQSICFLDEFLGINDGEELKTTRIGYPPLSGKSYKLVQFAPNGEDIAEHNRGLTRYRLVHGPIDFYLNVQFEKPIEIPLITACAPNLMGTSDIDTRKFSKGKTDSDRVLITDMYEAECKKLADFIVGAAANKGHCRLIMPTFGVGIYIQTLKQNSKNQAKEIMYKAFAEAALTHKIHIDWILIGKNAKKATEFYKSYAPKHPFIQPVEHDDMLVYAKECIDNGENVVLLNAGSDRTIGGKYTSKNPSTVEERIAQQSDLLFLHSELNKPMVKSFRKELSVRKKQLPANDYKEPFDTIEEETIEETPSFNTHKARGKTPNFDLKKIAEQIKQSASCNEAPWISKNPENNYKISFKNSNNATFFVKYLDFLKIGGKNGVSKSVQEEKPYFVVYLKPQQFEPMATKQLKTTGNSTPGFFKRPSQSALSKKQIGEITQLIKTLTKETQSFWSCNKGRKNVKIDALKLLLTLATPNSDLSTIAHQVLTKYPDANRGIFSNRTGELLMSLIDRTPNTFRPN